MAPSRVAAALAARAVRFVKTIMINTPVSCDLWNVENCTRLDSGT
jgi:hypothetical protein